MYYNHYNPELVDQPGTQPIRVLAKFCGNIFENLKAELIKEYPNCSEATFAFNINNIKVQSPYVVFNRITLPYTFLSFLWCSSYHFLNSIPHDGVGPHYPSIMSLRKYSVSLLHNYTDWDKAKLPNPEYYQKDIHEYVGKANFGFVVGVNYILYHEFAHVALEHEVSEDLDRMKEIEKEADLFAIKRIINNTRESWMENDEDTYTSVILSLLTSFATLTMTTATMNGLDHPDPDDRLLAFIEELTIEENDDLWFVAGWFLLQWQLEYRPQILDIPSTTVTRKESFMAIHRNFKVWKE